MAVTRLGLYELLAPQFLVGFTFPEYADRYLSILGVDELHTSSDATGVVYSGKCSFTGFADAAPVREHHDPSGAVFEWEDISLDFRLTLPRDGAAFIDSTLQTAGLVGASALNDLFVRFGPVEGTPVPTDYPGTRFRLELLLSAVKFHLGSSWLPATLDAEHRVIPDPARTSNDVSIVLPKVVFIYEQGDDLTRPPTFEVASWGSGGFDAPHDLLAGEAIRMEPPLAVHESGRVGLGLGQVVLDLSTNSTPPEILAFFGTDEAFKGVYVRSARVFYTDKDKDWAVNLAVQDVLISFAGEVSLEASIDIIGQESRMSVSVHLFEGTNEVQYVKGTTTAPIRPGEGTLLNTGVLHVRITGGVPPYTVSALIEGTQIWNATTRTAPISPGAPGTLRQPGRAHLVVHVEDAGTTGPSGTRKTYDEEIDLNVTAATPAGTALDGAPADRPPDRTDRPAAEPLDITSRSPSPLPAGYDLVFTPAKSGTAETLVVTGGSNPTVTVAGVARSVDARGAFTVEVPPNSDIPITVTWPNSPEQRETFRLLFQLGRPDPDIADASFPPIRDGYLADTEDPPDIPFSNSRAPSGSSGPPFGPAALRAWVQNRTVAGGFIAIDAHASFETVIEEDRDKRLSRRRLEVADAIVRAARPGVVFDHADPHGHDLAKSASRRNDASDRVALIEAATSVASTGASIQARIRRAAIPATPPAKPPEQPPAAAPEANRKPPVFRRAGLRIRLERNKLVLAEISGRLDLETDLEETLRTQTGDSSGDLGLTPTSAAVNENPEDGVVDFLLAITYDTATHTLAERLAIGASPDDLNGLFQMTNPAGASTFKNVFGSVLVMAPVINSAAAALDPASGGDWVKVAISLGVPAAIGALGVLKTEKVTLYGGEIALRQHVPPGESLTFTSAGVIFDYAVEFGIHIDQLDIHSTKPIKVRYKAVGFDLHFGGGVTYQPIFDTSKGYELDISDPSLLNLPAPLGNILKILSARIARLNPLTLEVDLGLKVDLGVVTVDRFKIKWPLDPLGPPSILPTGVKVDISGVLVGSGYLNIVEPTPSAEGVSGGGFDGTADVSLVPLKLRISASLGVRDLQVGNRKAIAIFAGLIVERTSPPPFFLLGQSGFGIFGFAGLFAMHYKRDELPPDGTGVSPALRWLIRAKGEPAKLIVDGDNLWVAELDRWSFGLGALIGSVDGTVVHLRGMFVLELPGPRILIFAKIEILADMPSLGEGGLDVGILGVVDLDFNLMQLTVGVVIDLGIGEIVKLTIPSEIFVKLNNPRIWHLYLGTHRAPASALILNLVRANGYFMAEGDRIEDWPGTDPASTLNGLALATGLEASIVLGDEDIGLYLRVAAGAHLGISFSPKLFVAGRIYLEGELHIFIVSVEARGELAAQVLVESPSDIRTFIDGKICGKVSFFFFSVEGCVRHSIGTPVLAPAPPPLISSVYLQSHAPVLTAGQGGDRPIDSSLGNAAAIGVTDAPVVPIDAVPVLQMTASPLVAGVTTFTTPIGASPQQTADGYISLGGERQAVYELRELSLSPPLATGLGTPPATWRTERPPNPTSSDTNIDLALMSREPTSAARALERSSDLDGLMTLRWENLCTRVAPATCVLYTFCGQALGPSGDGWRLSGTPQPDPPGTIRSTPPATVLDVEEPAQDAADDLIDLILLDAGLGTRFPAEIIGPNAEDGGEEPPDNGELVCVRFPRVIKRMPNPLVQGVVRFDVRDSTGASVRANRVIRRGNVTGLDVGFRTLITLDGPSRVVEVTLAQFSSAVRVVALDARGATVDSQTATADKEQSETLTLKGKAIARVRIDARQDETLLLRICFEARAPLRPPIEPRRFRPSGDERKDRRALEWFARAGERERLRAAAEADIATARALGSEPGLALVASTGVMTHRAGTAARATDRCFRALKLPMLSDTKRRDPLKVPDKIGKRGKKRPEDRWIILRTGRARQVVIYLAIAKPFVKAAMLLVRQLDAAGNVVHEDRVTDLSPVPVTSVSTGLPAEWMDAAGPWRVHVQPVATFLADPLFSALDRMVVTIKPVPKCDRIQLLVPPDAPATRPPGVLVGVVQVCPEADAIRQATDEAVQEGQIETVIDYLNGGSTVPLLAPNTTYTLRARYDISTRLVGGSPASAGSHTQEFRFKTDANPPARLDPYVLGTTPDAEERYHFYEDPLKLVFNDLAAIQLYAAYGKQLRFALRAADGLATPTYNISNLDPLTAEYLAPWRDFLEDMIAAGALPCVGTFAFEQHGSWTSPVPLRPLMDYTLDVELDPAPPALPDTEPRVPFFRRSFSTSRFPTLAALVADVKRKTILSRALTSQLSGLAGTGPVDIAADEAIQAALVAAGEQALPAANQAGIVIYWARQPGQTKFSPHAILIDAAEPLWRTRYEPMLETVPNQLDPAYKRIVPARADALVLLESGSSAIARFVHSPGGTRTLAILKDSFNPPAAGGLVTIVARRPASTLYGLSVVNETLLALPLTPNAPWEADDA